MSSNKALNSVLAFSGPNFLESVDVAPENATSVLADLVISPVRPRVIRSRLNRVNKARMVYKKAFQKNTLLNELSNDIRVVILETSEPVIRPEIYALAALGRDEPDHELQGSTREELRASLKRALQQMPG